MGLLTVLSRRRGVAALLCAPALACALVSCTGGPGSGDGDGDGGEAEARARASATAGATGRPLLSRKAAREVVDHYVEVNNKANARQDAKLLSTVEGGALFARSEAGYKQFDTLSKKEKEGYLVPFTYEDVSFHIPAKGDWFAATARVDHSKQRRLLVFDRTGPETAEGKRGGWKLTAVAFLEEKLPRVVEGADGAAAVADTGEAPGEAPLAPDRLPSAVTDLYVTGGEKAGAKLARTKPVRRALKIHRERDEVLAEMGVRKRFVADEPEDRRAYALRTADGGVLAVVPVAHTVELTARSGERGKGGKASVTPSSAEAVYDGSARRTITDDHLGQAVAHLPPSGAPRVLGADYAMINSR
ncbi:hypothetical protein [Streptomyces daliensis]